MEPAEALARLAASPAEAAVLLDVDGTLAPIVPRPSDARVPEGARRILAGLTERYGLVACISGRPAADARRVVGVDGIRYFGEHGLELHEDAGGWTARLETFARSVAWPTEPGKRLSLSFHYREVDDVAAAEAALGGVAERAQHAGLRVRWGRRVLEVRPPLDADKGTAVQRLLADAGLGRALYAGDDATDLDAFRGLDGLELAVRIAVASEEAPPILLAAADLVVDSSEALTGILAGL